MLVEFLVTTCLMGSGDMTAPKTVCTPGSYDRIACVTRDRPTLRAADRREILRRYRITTWSGKDGELDHRVPFFLGGRTDPSNIWPERGRIPNTKDRLENYVYRRVCVKRTMAKRYARHMFQTDWRVWYKRYQGELG